MCNATQPATINLLSRNVGGPRIPIKSSSVCAQVCAYLVCVLTYRLVKVLQLSVNSPSHPDLQTQLITIHDQFPIWSMWGHAVATTNGITVKLGSTHITDTWPKDTFSTAALLSA